MADITIPEMVRNGTMSAEIAAVLWAAVDEQVSFLTVAIPRFAGKTTTSKAALALRPANMPVHWVEGRVSQMDQLLQEKTGGYLAVEEFDRAPVPGYIWGPPVQRVFATAVEAGYGLQAVLHASGVDEAIEVVTRGNGVSDAHASILKLIVYIERFGTNIYDFKRRVTDVYELHAIENGRPIGHSLFRWHAQDDRFEKIMDPHQWGKDRQSLLRRTDLMAGLAEQSRTDSSQVASALLEYRAVNQEGTFDSRTIAN